MNYHIITYGCQMNKSDSERIAGFLEKLGYKKALKMDRADLIIVNMCSVRQSAVDRVFGLIPKFNKLPTTNYKLQTVLTGCVLKKDRKKFAQYFDNILDIKNLPNWSKFLPKLQSHEAMFRLGTSRENCNYLGIRPKYSSFPVGYLPVSTGCNYFCSYCVVPHTRGPEFYRPADEILREIKNLIKKGSKEICLLGQKVNSYPKFVELLQKITALPGDFKLKFITNHPKDFSDELIDEIARNNKIIKYIHLPVQSGDNEILRKMNRKYTREEYLTLITKIKAKIPNVELTTDVIVGFPGETEKKFQNTVRVFEEVKFANAYIAKYSPRPGTAASKLQDNVPLEEKKGREQILRKIIKENG